MSFRSSLVPVVLALVFAACDGGGSGAGGGGGVTLSASKIALATVNYPPNAVRNGYSLGSVTLVVRTASGASPARIDLLGPETMTGIKAEMLRAFPGGAVVRILWDGSMTPGKAALRVVVRGETVSVPIEFVAPTGLSTRSETLMDASADPVLLLPGTTGTSLVTLGIASASEVLTFALISTSATSASVTLAAPVTIAAGTAVATKVPVTLRMGASVAPGTVDTMLIHVTRPDGALVSTGEIVVRTTAAPASGTKIQHVPYDRALWPYADTTGIRNVYRWGDVSFRSTLFRTVALRADGRVFVFLGGDTTRNLSPPEGFRAVAIGGGGALDPLGGIRDVVAGFVVAHVPSWGKATAVGGGFFSVSGYDQNYRTIAGYADGWVRDISQVGGVAPLESARLPSAPLVVGAGHVSLAALTADGTVYTWGQNDDGMLGRGTSPFDRTALPVAPVPGLPPLVRLFIGPKAITGIDRTGARWGWGNFPNSPATSGCPPNNTPDIRRCLSPVRL